MKIVFTGGHHSSALPIIHELQQNHPEVEIFWFGHRHTLIHDKNDSLEYQQISSLGIKFYELHAGKFYKTFNIKRLLLIPYGFIQAFFLLKTLRPDVIMSFGGYLAVPTVISGWVLGIKSFTHEQTLVSGYANKLIGKFASKVFISWKNSSKFFDSKKVVFTGLPLRKEIFSEESSDFGVNPNLPTISIIGGKTGSHAINKVVQEILPKLLEKYNVIHQIGDYSETNDYAKLVEAYKSIGVTNGKYFPVKYVFDNQIGEFYKKADLVISRSGAHTIAELLALKKKCLLIPISWVSHNEQNINAKMLVDLGIASLQSEDTLTPANLLEKIDFVINKSIDANYEVSDYLQENSHLKIINELLKK